MQGAAAHACWSNILLKSACQESIRACRALELEGAQLCVLAFSSHRMAVHEKSAVFSCRALEREEAQLCVLADDCNQADYKKLVESLCKEKSCDLVRGRARLLRALFCIVVGGPLLLASRGLATMYCARKGGVPWLHLAACGLCQQRPIERAGGHAAAASRHPCGPAAVTL